MIKDLEELLASNENFLLGVWIESSKQTGSTPQHQANREFNARNQLTMWGPDQNIEDYAAKQWGGLVGDYYYSRWKLFTDRLIESVRNGQIMDFSKYEADRLKYEQAWSRATNPFPTTPSGNTLQIAYRLNIKYTTDPDTSAYSAYNNADILGHDLLGEQTWTRDVAQLKILCDTNPTCQGFNSNGWLKNISSPIQPVPGSILYIKQ